MLSPSKSVFYQNLNQITEMEKNLKRVSEDVKCLSKSGLKCKADMKLNKALLKKKKLEVLALVARSQAVLATMEVLIAENELEEMKSAKELRDEKKKCEINGQPNAKKSKIGGGREVPEPVDKSKKPRKQSKKSPETSPKDKKLCTLAPNENLASSTPTTLAQKKTNDKENHYKSTPSYGKQLIILSRPPIRSDVTCNQIGYLSNTQSLRHNKIENSIYNHAENIKQFAKTMSLATNESFQKRYQPLFNQQGFYNQNVTSAEMIDFNQNLSNCNQNMINVGNQNLNQNVGTTYQTSDFNQNNLTVCNQNIANVSIENINCQMANFNQNIVNDNRKGCYQNPTSSNQNNYIYQKNTLQDSAFQTNIANVSEIRQNFEKISTDSSENAYGNFLETTNQIFKDIMAKKGTMNIPIKIEKENIPDDNSENTLVIDIPSSKVY